MALDKFLKVQGRYLGTESDILAQELTGSALEVGSVFQTTNLANAKFYYRVSPTKLERWYPGSEILSMINSAVAVEEAARIAADAALQTAINSEIASRIAGDAALQSAIDSEEAARIAGDAALQTSISNEVTARTAADTALQNAIDAEEAARITGDAALQTAISNEVTARTAADTALQNSIDAEVTARTAADTALQTAISNEVTARTAADTTLQNAINSEETARISGDAALQTAINSEISARTSGDAALQSAIDGEVAARIAADSAEVTARTAADTALQSAIDGEISARIAGDSAEATTRAAADAALQAALTAEIADRTAADSALQTAINNEVSARTAGDTTLQSNINALETALTAAIANAVEDLRDTTVADIIPVTYTNGQSSTLSSLLGSGRPDGVYYLPFYSGDVNNTMTVTGLPVSLPGAGDITYGDRLKVVIDGGSVVSAEKVDDITKAKFNSLDASIASIITDLDTLEASMVSSVGNGLSLDTTGGLNKAVLGGTLDRNTTVSQAGFRQLFTGGAFGWEKGYTKVSNVDSNGYPTGETANWARIFVNGAGDVGVVLLATGELPN